MVRTPIIVATVAVALAVLSPPTISSYSQAQSVAGYKFVGQPPAPLRVAHEDWAAVRQRIQEDPATREWVQNRQKRLDGWNARFKDKLDWVAGWGHNLLDPSTGLPTPWSWTMAEPANATQAEQKLHGAWVYNLDWAARQLDFYSDGYAKWPIQHLSGVSQLMGQSLDEATNGIALADAVRIIGSSVPSARRQRWRDGLFKPMLVNLRVSNRGQNNIAMWQAAAAAILAVELGDEAAYRDAINGDNGIRAMLARGVTTDHLWFEPSVAYGQYTQRALGTLFLYLSLTGRAEPLRHEILLTQDMMATATSMRFADGTLPAFGDSVPGIRAFDPSLLAITQRTMPLRVPELPLTWDTVLDPNLPTAPTPTEQASRFWPASQAAMLRRGGWELFTSWGQQSASHAQGDALSYELRYKGAVVSGAAGTANYGSELFLKYLRTSAAHNQPLIDGEGETRFGPGVLVGADASHLIAHHPGFGSAQVARTMTLNEQGAKIETRIVTAGAAHRLGDVFNTSCQFATVAPLARAQAPLGLGLNWWKRTQVSPPLNEWSTTLACGRARFRLSIHASSSGRVFVSQAPDRTGSLTRIAIYFEAPAAEVLATTWNITPY
jgi:hypothetical protein